MWKRNSSREWELGYEYNIQTALEANDSRKKDIENKETERLLRMMARMAMKKWMNASTRRAWQSWYDDHLEQKRTKQLAARGMSLWRGGERAKGMGHGWEGDRR